MSKEKTPRNKQNKSILMDECDSLFDNLKRQNSMNAYLRKSVRRDSYDYKDFKHIADNYINQNQFSNKQNKKINNHDSFSETTLERKIEEIIEKKLKCALSGYVQKYIKKIFEEHRVGLELYYSSEIQSVQSKIQQLSNQIVQNKKQMDLVLKVVDNLKEKSKKRQKFAAKNELQTALAKINTINSELVELKTKFEGIDLGLKKIIDKKQKNNKKQEQKVCPVILNYEQKCDIGLQDLKIVVNTFNHNFIQIDDKLKDLYTRLT